MRDEVGLGELPRQERAYVPPLERVFEGLEIRGRRLRSRVYLPAHQEMFATDGVPGQRYLAYHRVRAKSGIGMQITGAVPVMQSSRWRPNELLRNMDDRIIPGYQKLADVVHGEGGCILTQLAHAGAEVSWSETGMSPVAPSPVVSEMTREYAREITPTEIEEVVEAFAKAAERARKADLDGIEILMAWGLLLGAFLSPLTNTRTDGWGGSRQRRLRLPLEVIAAVREAIGPAMILGVRMPGDELVKGGIDQNEAAALAGQFADTGEVDYISVIAGNNLFQLPRVLHWAPTPMPHATFRPLAAFIKRAVPNILVTCVGRVTTLDEAEEILVSGDADLVGMVRAHIADPMILKKARAQQNTRIRPCVGANVCIDHFLRERPIRCLANPEVGEEWRLQETVEADGDGKTAVVVGGGPGGLEAARMLAQRKFRVVLFDQEHALGGQMLQWASVPSRDEFLELVAWWERELAELGVEVRLSSPADARRILAERPSCVVLATGSAPLAPVTPLESASVTRLGVLEAFHSSAGGTAVVIDRIGRIDAALVAERLRQTCSRVVIVTSCVHVAEGEAVSTLYTLLERLARLEIEVVERVRPVRLVGRSLELAAVFGGSGGAIDDVDVLVEWRGAAPNDGLAQEMKDAGLPFSIVGDARGPRRVEDAVYEGWRAGRTLQAA